MEFPQMSFNMSVAVSATTKAHDVAVTINAGAVDDVKVIECLVGGNSPRVRLQSNLRRAEGGIPSTYECSWEEFIVGKRGPRTTTKVLSPEQTIAAAQANPVLMAQLRKALGLDQ